METANQVMERLKAARFPHVADGKDVMHGDMPGDKIEINASHIQKAEILFPALLEKLAPVLEQNPRRRAVISVCGGSGVGKSEIAGLLGYGLQANGIGSYVLSGDNYPHRIPAQNDAERLRIFRWGGMSGLAASGQYTSAVGARLRALQEQEVDADPARAKEEPWLAVYQREGRRALSCYLGSPQEQNFDELNGLIRSFKTGAEQLCLKRMGRNPLDLWYEIVDFSHTNVLLIEWTHGNSNFLAGVDIPILLNSTPQETLEHRRSRNRDGGVDSPFVTMVLEIEQAQLHSQAAKAALIVSKSGELLTYDQYCRLMAGE